MPDTGAPRSGSTDEPWVNAVIEVTVPIKAPWFVSDFRKQDEVADFVVALSEALPPMFDGCVISARWENFNPEDDR